MDSGGPHGSLQLRRHTLEHLPHHHMSHKSQAIQNSSFLQSCRRADRQAGTLNLRGRQRQAALQLTVGSVVCLPPHNVMPDAVNVTGTLAVCRLHALPAAACTSPVTHKAQQPSNTSPQASCMTFLIAISCCCLELSAVLL
jgi:hypothetical protein